MSCGSCCGGAHCAGCKFIKIIVAIVVTVLVIAALIGVYNTHMTLNGWEFGSLNGSAAIIASLLGLKYWLKLCKKLCPCGKSGGSCGSGGACHGCGHDPCTCK